LSKLFEIRFHGRGGQGAWTASLLLAQAGLLENKQIQSFPAFGPERAGAPMAAFTRISDEPIQIHSSVYEPDMSVVLDPTLLGPSVIEGFKPSSKLVLNTSESGESVKKRLSLIENEVWTVDATALAIRVMGVPITNTALLGAVVKASDMVKLESILAVVKERFSGKTRDQNLEVIQTAYLEAVKS
jgi:2-oxoacid:acceptor oxidoreductase gamma subunit (pyruvate/2-ketoisovalerate family)